MTIIETSFSGSACRQMEAWLPPFVDGEASAAVCADVEAHLAVCAACRDAVRAERAVRSLLVSRRQALVEPAPTGLAAEVRSAATASARPRWTALGRLARAAALVLAVMSASSWATSHSSVLLAAQLTLDHLKCFVIDGHDHDHPLTAEQAEARFRDTHGLDVRVPVPPATGGAALVSVRECLYGDGWVAHALYRVEGEAVSLFIMRGRTATPASVATFGSRAEVVSRDGATYVLVAPSHVPKVAEAVGLEAE